MRKKTFGKSTRLFMRKSWCRAKGGVCMRLFATALEKPVFSTKHNVYSGISLVMTCHNTDLRMLFVHYFAYKKMPKFFSVSSRNKYYKVLRVIIFHAGKFLRNSVSKREAVYYLGSQGESLWEKMTLILKSLHAPLSGSQPIGIYLRRVKSSLFLDFVWGRCVEPGEKIFSLICIL